jgi:signal transduction histidine kinase
MHFKLTSEGAGIGLFIVNKMVDNQGGRIEVKSKLNIGTTFTIFLKRQAVSLSGEL